MLPPISQRKQMLSGRRLLQPGTQIFLQEHPPHHPSLGKERSWHNHSSIWSLDPTATYHLWNLLLSYFFFQLLQPLSGTSLLWCLCPPSVLVHVQQLLIPLLSNTKVSSPLPLLHPCYTLHGPSGLDLRLPFHSESSGWYLQWSLCSHIQCTWSRPHLKWFFNSLWLCQPFYFTKYFSLGFYDLTTCCCSFFLSSHTTSISFVGYPLPPACMQWNCLKPSPNQSFSP